MGDSIVDLGAAAADYVGNALSGAYDYLTGTPEASASGGYYKKLGPGARQYYPGPGDYKKSNPVMEYFGFGGGGVVSLGAGDPGYIDMGDMSMNEGFGLSRDDPAYMQESGFSGPAYAEDQTRPADLLGPFFEEYNPVDGEYKRLEYYDMYQDFAPSVTGLRPEDLESGQADEMLDIKGFRSAKKLYMQDGGEPTREEAFLQAEASKRESAIQLLNSLSEDELVQQFGVEGYQRLLADAGIFNFDGFQIQPQIDARVSETGSTQNLGPFDLARTQQQGRGRLGFAANVEDFGTFGAGVTGGFSKGEVEFPDELRRMGAPDKIKYGSGKLDPQSYDAFYQFPRGGPRITGQYMPSETGEDQYGVNMGYTIPFEDGGSPAVEGIMSVDLSKGADTTGPDTMQPIPQYPGIEGFDIYKDLAPEQFKRRPIDKQMFDKKRGFQFGQMVELRNEAVGGKLLKQAGIQAPVKQVLANLDPKVMEQVSTILGREVG
jgi:hypothetical protein